MSYISMGLPNTFSDVLNVSSKKICSKAEDYLRTIYEIVMQKGFARIKGITRELDVKPPSVVEMMKKLDDKGLVVYEKYGGVTQPSKEREMRCRILTANNKRKRES